ncbi:MAG: hypothetical protein IPQ27_06795 [Chitinophagaceae bacterium]|nr:hypothetical protein [Chitinophagaceae bacterium]MBL0254669.1 hypothetical protein [Chitinophagaceae bacterium]
MKQLNISLGNVNLNFRQIIDWELLNKVIIQRERKVYLSAEKDILKVATHIIKERKKGAGPYAQTTIATGKN